MTEISSPLENLSERGFLVHNLRGQQWYCLPHIVSYFSSIHEGKHEWNNTWVSVPKRCIRCFSTLDYLSTI